MHRCCTVLISLLLVAFPFSAEAACARKKPETPLCAASREFVDATKKGAALSREAGTPVYLRVGVSSYTLEAKNFAEGKFLRGPIQFRLSHTLNIVFLPSGHATPAWLVLSDGAEACEIKLSQKGTVKLTCG